jgi:hypothetical protein
MSIFKDTFKPGVQAQLKARQEAINERTPAAIQYFNARNSWIRMTSSVNVGEDAGALAKKYILLGGILYENKARTGVGTENQAYSTLSPGGATNMLGIRPMPGITGINVKSLGAYGSLREVTVNFQCWDIRQLEELELLYMRPGYSVLVEWGWAPYLTNEKNLQGNISFVDDVLNGNDGNPSKETIWKKIFEKASTDGNYEGHYGFVKNYSWSVRPDGGYDCTTSIISMGEVLESLKVNFGNFDVSTSSTKGIYGVLPADKFAKDSTIFKAYNQNKLAGIIAELYEIAKSKATTTIGGSSAVYPEVEFNGYKFFRFNIDVAGKTAGDTICTDGAQIYMPLKDFISVLNSKILLNITKLSVFCGEHNGGINVPLYCTGHPLQISTDPSICLIKNMNWSDPANLGLNISESDFSTTKSIMSTLTQDYWKDGIYDDTQQLGIIGNIYINLDFIYSLITDPNVASQDKKEKNDISLLDFIKSLMSQISTVIGNVSTFELFADPTDGIARIIDVNYTGNRDDDWNAVTAVPIEVQNTKSIVRSYKLESQIFPEQGTIVAIGAQAKGGALGENVNTLIDFNQNLIDRINPKKEVIETEDEANAKAAAQEASDKQKAQNLIDNLAILTEYIVKIDPGWFEFKGDFNAEESSKYSNSLKDLINYFRSLVKSDSNNRALIPTKLSIDMDGIGGMVIGNLFKIPEEFLPRGYKGGGPGSPGPKRIAYAVTGLSHTVQNSDWTTTIESQFIIMDEPKGSSTIDLKTIKSIIKVLASENVEQSKDAIAKIDPAKQPGPPSKDIPPSITVDRVIAAMQKKKYSFYANTDFGKSKLNIVGIRASDKAFNSPSTNYFTDHIVMFYYEDGKRYERIGWLTTAPGLTYEAQKFGGTGRTIMMQEGQYIDAYTRGLHQGKVDTLVQRKLQQYHRDESLNAQYNSVRVEGGVFGTNIHPSGQYGATDPKKLINNWSAGCQVFRSYDDYLWMMQAVRNQIAKTNHKFFTYTLLNIKDL